PLLVTGKTMKIRAIVAASALFCSASYAALPETVTVGTDGSYVPFAQVNADGSLGGFEVDVVRNLCERAKVKCVFTNQSFDALIPSLQSHKIDIISGWLLKTPTRERVVAFSNTYAIVNNRFIAKKGSNITISPEGLKGKTIAIEGGSAQDSFLTKTYGNTVNIKRYTGQGDPFLDLKNGRVDLTFGYTVQTDEAFLKLGDNSKNFEYIGPSFTGSNDPTLGAGVGLGFRKDESELREAFNRAIAAAKADGTFTKVSMKYFGHDITAAR
ncbi:transporter substrate-binding domain-containing protein, partial [Paraburkholderia sp. RL18-085-BIA-A]|uniref:transporter substrate-binding domain-containing protein n=2 Tax=unclassified Paraburkholderia TaxID=2615204 RepID=UPI0038BC1A60